ncbi:MAG TPA: twin-arginine translocase subunit TatC, partial [Chthoniobacterales bacterium]
YYSFATQFIVAFGVAFEMPIAVLVLVKLGIVDVRLLRRTRPFAVILILIFSAAVTPTQDMLTLLLMAGPMYVLYEICILLARFFPRRGGDLEDA